jgi:hypothetical protein
MSVQVYAFDALHLDLLYALLWAFDCDFLKMLVKAYLLLCQIVCVCVACVSHTIIESDNVNSIIFLDRILQPNPGSQKLFYHYLENSSKGLCFMVENLGCNFVCPTSYK